MVGFSDLVGHICRQSLLNFGFLYIRCLLFFQIYTDRHAFVILFLIQILFCIFSKHGLSYYHFHNINLVQFDISLFFVFYCCRKSLCKLRRKKIDFKHKTFVESLLDWFFIIDLCWQTQLAGLDVCIVLYDSCINWTTMNRARLVCKCKSFPFINKSKDYKKKSCVVSIR